MNSLSGDYIERFVKTPSDNYRVIELDMYKILLEILDEKRVLGSVPLLEEKKGKDYLLAQPSKDSHTGSIPFQDEVWASPIWRCDIPDWCRQSIPFMRSHKMLDSMQQVFSDYW